MYRKAQPEIKVKPAGRTQNRPFEYVWTKRCRSTGKTGEREDSVEIRPGKKESVRFSQYVYY